LHTRPLRLLSGLVALGLVMAACGSDDDSSTDNTTTTAGDDTTTTEGGGETEANVSLDDLCQEAKDAGVEAPDGFTVRLVTDIGKVDDRTFNQYAYEGMRSASASRPATSRRRLRRTTPRTSTPPSRTTRTP
jgi:basic membrane protein A